MSVTAEPALVSFLSTDVGLSNLVGQRIWPQKSPQGLNRQDKTFPRILYSRITTDRAKTTDGPCPPTNVTFQFKCQGLTEIDAKNIAEALRVATGGAPTFNTDYNQLDGFKGIMGTAPNTINVQGAFLTDDSDDVMPPAHEGDIGAAVFEISLLLSLWFSEN